MTKYKKIAYSFLIGDLLNYGHLKMLETAKKNANYHVCGVVSDSVAKKWTSPLICSYKERKAVIEKISDVDEVISQNSMDPTENLKILHEKYPEAQILLTQSHLLWSDMLGVDYINQIKGDIIKHKYYSYLSRENIAQAFFQSYVKERKLGDLSFNKIKNTNTVFFQKYFSTKANTLKHLKRKIKNALIEKSYIFNVSQWQTDEDAIVLQIKQIFKKTKIVARSSSLKEDSLTTSNAGCFQSILNIDSDDSLMIKKAINKVIESYKKTEGFSSKDQILVQEQTQNVLISGVIFTRNLWTNTPYYLINYDDSENMTDTVTSGMINNKIEIARDTPLKDIAGKWRNLISVIKEIESYYFGIALDVEFAINKDNKIVIFQVRPLAANSKFLSLDDKLIKKTLQKCKKDYLDKKTNLLENSGQLILSDMAFWNPAELIGDRPNYLDYSLFNHLIMKSVWNEALVPFNYTKIEDGLMFNIGGKPYVIVNYAFLCLLPTNLPQKIKNKLMEFYIKKLKKNSHLHDKIEFDITYNCYTFNFDNRAEELKEYGFDKEEIDLIKTTLIKLTNDIFNSFDEYNRKDREDIKLLETKYGIIKNKVKQSPDWRNKLNLIYELIEDCRKLGTAQFTRIARLAFISNALLRSFKEIGTISPIEFDNFMNSISTVATDMDNDFSKLRSKQISISEFLNKYGHLRPGTYDITKLPYEKNSSYINSPSSINSKTLKAKSDNKSNLSKEFVSQISSVCKKHQLNIDGKMLLKFIKKSIEFRELYKFIYTKNISLALELIAQIGEEFGFTRENLANLDYYSIISSKDYCSKEELINIWNNLITSRKEEKRVNSLLSLTSIVFSEKDFLVVSSYKSSPNFITDATVSGKIIFLDREKGDTDLNDKIVIIEKADPGYDWIFTKKIKALITKYGGLGSHMSIRCAEFGIPAAIGCGEMLFSKLMTSDKVILDCKNKQIKT